MVAGNPANTSYYSGLGLWVADFGSFLVSRR